jgi:vacuolar-type H+-ATPase subunit E/Vma4
MNVIGSVDSVIATIRAEADAEIERLRATGDQELARLRELPPQSDPPDREARLAAARKHNDELSAQMDWEEHRRVIEQREAWMARVIARGNELLRSASVDERRQSLTALTREALRSVSGENIELRLSAADREIVDDAWCRDIPPGLHLGETAPIRGGCLVRSGPLVFDNSFEERAKRLEPVWRKALAGAYRV